MTFAASSRSHEKLDVPEGRIAIDEIDALEFDPQLAVNDSQCVGRPGGVKLLVVVPGFDVVHRSPGHEFVVGFICGVCKTWWHRLMGFCEYVRLPLSRSIRMVSSSLSSYISEVVSFGSVWPHSSGIQ